MKWFGRPAFRYRVRTLAIITALSAACGEDDEAVLNYPATAERAPFTVGDQQLVYTATFYEIAPCGNIYATFADETHPYQWYRVFKLPAVTLMAGQKYLLEGQTMTASSTASTAMEHIWRIERRIGTGPWEVISPDYGTNHTGASSGDPDKWGPEVYVRGTWIYTAPQTGSYEFSMVALVATDAAGVPNPPLTPCVAPPSPRYWLAFHSGGGNSFLKISSVHANSREVVPPHSAQGAIMMSETAPTTIFSVLETSAWQMPTGRNLLNVTSYIQFTTHKPDGYSGSDGWARLVVTNTTTGVTSYFPSNPNFFDYFNITNAKHHYRVYLEGFVSGGPGDIFDVHAEVAHNWGNRIIVDLGGCTTCTPAPARFNYGANLSLWPSNCGFNHIATFENSQDGWVSASCANYAYQRSQNRNNAYSGERYLSSWEVVGGSGTSGSGCDPVGFAGLEMSYRRSFLRTNTQAPFKVSGWAYTGSNYDGGVSPVTNYCVAVMNPTNNTVLAIECRDWPSLTDTGWTNFEHDFTSPVGSLSNVQVVLGSYDSWSSYHDQGVFFDDIRVHGCPQ